MLLLSWQADLRLQTDDSREASLSSRYKCRLTASALPCKPLQMHLFAALPAGRAAANVLTGMAAAGSADCSTNWCYSLLDSSQGRLLAFQSSSVQHCGAAQLLKGATTGTAPQRAACWGAAEPITPPSRVACGLGRSSNGFQECPSTAKSFPADRMTSNWA